MAGADGALEHQGFGAIIEALSTRRLLIVSGKGGVGRTTVAALMGLALARRGRKVLIATTGHDDRLAWMVGAERLTATPTRVAEGLWVHRLEPQTCIREYGGLVLKSQKISSAVFDNRVVKRLLRAIPGLDDFAVLGKVWHEAVRGDDFDTVIFDGPATGHLLYTLSVPQAILETIPPGPLTREARLMQRSFEDRTQVEAVLVGLPERWPLTELGELGVAIADRIHMSVSSIVVNGVWPSATPGLPTIASDPRVHEVLSEVAKVRAVGEQQRTDVDAWSRSAAAVGSGAGVWTTLPWRWEGIAGAQDIHALLSEAQEGSA